MRSSVIKTFCILKQYHQNISHCDAVLLYQRKRSDANGQSKLFPNASPFTFIVN